ncbi:MAG: hypothetical protein WCV70_00280 [Patescibacteria group bacterium]|jgi:hypothetical protein
MKKNIIALKNFYIFLFIIIVAVILLTPWLIRQGFSILDEETLEVIIIGLLFIVSYVIYVLYQNEIKKNLEALKDSENHRLTLEERLDEAFKHIGQVNVQIQEIRSIFSGLKKYPENKNDFKNILKYFAEKVLSIIAVDWVLFKIIDINSVKTLGEHSQCREGAVFPINKIGNHDLIDKISLEAYNILRSDQNDLKIKVYCITPKIEIAKQTEIFIKAVVNQLEMLFLIFSSNYYKNNKIINNQENIQIF